ncbi:MAG: hypothetical protein QOH21_3315 [Acidobacteriota bacterium]|jgi:hypothetical protein|nr:hypothetical protein [Acidobacteriota bacterium]
MDQDNPVGSGGFGGGTGSGGGSMSGSDVGSGSGSSSMGGGTVGGIGGTSSGGSGGTGDSGICATCGQSTTGGLEQFLGKIGITSDMIDSLKGQWQSVDLDEYMNTAREYLKDGSNKATSYAKENPGKVAAGVAALAVGVGLIYAAANRDKA